MKEKEKKNNAQGWKKEKNKKQKKSPPSIHTVNQSNESPEPCTSYGTASNRSKRKTQESA